MSSFRGVIFLASLLLVSSSETGHAQHLPLNLRLEDIYGEPGFSDFSTVIHQDATGFIWLAGVSHVTQHDGAGRQVYRHVPFDTTTIDGGASAIASTSDGNIWLGTLESGVNRMTGYGGRVERWGAVPDDPRGLTARSVVGLLVDSNDRVWVGTVRGLNRFDEEHNRFVHYLHDPSDPASLPGDFVGALVEDPSGAIWVGTNRGLARYDEGRNAFEPFRIEYRSPRRTDSDYEAAAGDQPYQHVRSIYFDDLGRAWVVLSEYSAGAKDFALQPFGLLARFDAADGSLHPFEFIDGGRSVGVASVLQDERGRYWAATGKGLALFDPSDGVFTLVGLWQGDIRPLGEVPIVKMTIDRQGTLWIAWTGSAWGIGRIFLGVPGIVTHRVRQSRLDRRTAAWIDAVISSRDGGALWFSTGNEDLKPPTGLTRLDRVTGRETQYRHDPGDSTSLSNNHILEIVERHDGKLWIGTAEGLNLLDPVTGSATRYYLDGERLASKPGTPSLPYPTGRNPNWIQSIALVSDNELWVSTQGQGAVHVDVETGTNKSYVIETPATERAGHVSDVMISRTGHLWMLVPGGVARLDPKTGESTLFEYDPSDPTSISGRLQNSIHEDAQGRIWVGGYDGGLNLFEPGSESWKHYLQEEGPKVVDHDERDWGPRSRIGPRVNCITHDNLGYVWVTHIESIWRYDPASGTSKGFWYMEGVQSGAFVPDNCSRSPRGELVFGGQRGFTIVEPDLIAVGAQPLTAVITAVGVSGVVLRPGLDQRLPAPLSRTDAVRLDHDENNLLFEYAGIDLAHTVRKFAYRLEPLEDLWQAAGSRQSVAYANLDPGEYSFMVRFSAAGHISNTASIRIIITPPWWETWPAFMLFASVGMGILYGGYRYRVRRLKAYSQRLEREVVQRTRDLEEERRKTEEQAERLLELDHVKNRFFANISHEFRTPLTLVVGPLQDAIEGAFDDDRDELRRQHSVMLANARRLLRLINQLLDLSKLESGKLELDTQPGDLVPFLRRLTRSFAPSAERRDISFGFRSDVESLPCLFDEDKLEKIVSNLVSNAFKFTPSGGKVAVEVKSQRNEETTHVELAVKDTGRGIASEDLERVFDRFQQADTSTTREYQGTGIGLSLARELTELHGGTISVESQVGFGSTFRVEIQLRNVPADLVSERPVPGPTAGEPADLVDAEAKPEIDTDAASGNGRHEVILVVDDNAEVRLYVKSHLASHFQVIEADNGEMGLTAAKEHLPDLILADVMMPKMDGFEMVRRIREIESLRHVPIVMLTAKADEQDVIEGIVAGADDYVSKPFRFGELETRIASLIRRRREMRERFSDEVVIKGSDIVVTSDDAAFLQRVTTIVDERLGHASFGGDWLADEVGLSRRQLERKMETILGESPAALIRRLRLERASQLLRARAGTVAEIAYSVGFTNAAYFARAFKNAYGESPSGHTSE